MLAQYIHYDYNVEGMIIFKGRLESQTFTLKKS